MTNFNCQLLSYIWAGNNVKIIRNATHTYGIVFLPVYKTWGEEKKFPASSDQGDAAEEFLNQDNISQKEKCQTKCLHVRASTL
jgi:hypothetical protein